MAGQSLNKEKVKESLQNWLMSVTQSETSWEGNDLHIDEIEILKNVKREEWIDSSFSVFEFLLNQSDLPDSLMVFLHIDLSYTETAANLDVITTNWLMKNINEFTPPSFNCTSLDYYEKFYKVELNKCDDVDQSILNLFGSNINLNFFYRTYFDDSEKMYSRELYVFQNK
jgi:hypothetical protein